MKTIFLTLFSIFLNQVFNAQDSLVLEPSFGNSGYAIVDITNLNTQISEHPSNQNEYFKCAFEKSNGKIILFSYFRTYDGDSTTIQIRQINSNGTTDGTFNNGEAYQSIILNDGVSDYTQAIMTEDEALVFFTNGKVYRLDPLLDYALDVSFNGGMGYYFYSAGFGTGIQGINYFKDQNILSITGSTGNSFVKESKLIDATTGLYVGQIETQDWDFNPFNGNINASDCLVNDTLMYQLGSSDNLDQGEYTYFVHIRSFSLSVDTIVSLNLLGAAFENQKLYGVFLDDKSLLICFYNFTTEVVQSMHILPDGTIDTNYGVQYIDNLPGIWDISFVKTGEEIYLYSIQSNLRRVYKFDNITGYLDLDFCNDGVLNLANVTGASQSFVSSGSNLSLFAINSPSLNGGTIPFNQNSLKKYVIEGSNHLENLAKNETIVYPNPVNSQLFIQSEKKIQEIEIMDIYGKIVYKTKVNDLQITLNLTDFSNGNYFISIDSFIEKLIIQH